MLTNSPNNLTPPAGASEELLEAATRGRGIVPPKEALQDVPAVAAPRSPKPTEDRSAVEEAMALEPGRARRYVRAVKPVVDFLGALLLLLLTLPILLAGVLAVRITMGPGVIFRQQRVGQHGRVFTVYKLRTMKHDRRSIYTGDLKALSQGRWDGLERRRTHKTEADPRHTDVGRILRRLSIDELPQLVNVLRGEMSLVGPRPELPVVVDKHYEPWMHRRHAVKPGVTGLWQISMRGEGDMHLHVDVDVDYVDRIGPLEDLRILLATPWAALGTQKGA